MDDYQVNLSDNAVYLIDENGRHQSLQLLRNQETPNFEVSANGLLTYMQYDSKKIVESDKESILFCYHPMYLIFSYDKDGKLELKSCVADDNGKVVSITIDGYQVNISCNSIYLIDE